MDVGSFAAGAAEEEPAVATARARAADMGLRAVSPVVGSLLATLARLVGARTVVETGTGTGVSALWLLRGMAEGGVLTSVDDEAECQRLAREALTEAGVPAARARLITGRALEVMPRLADDGYDLAHLDAGPADQLEQLQQALRLLRPGGVAVVSGVLGGRAGDADTGRAQELLTAIAADPTLQASLLPLGDGVLVVATS